MSEAIQIQLIGFKEFQMAIKRNPKFIASEAKQFIQKALTKYKSGIMSSPWRVGGSGGGSPVSMSGGGKLRDSHLMAIGDLEGRIFPTATYAKYVHEGTSSMKARPWLDFVSENKDVEIQGLADKMLKNIVNNLAK